MARKSINAEWKQIQNTITPNMFYFDCEQRPVLTNYMLKFHGNNVIKAALLWNSLRIQKVALSVTDLRLLHTIHHFNKAIASGAMILTSLFGHDSQLTMFKVTLNKHTIHKTSLTDIWCADISSIPLFRSADTCGSRTTGPFHNNVPKNDSPPCLVMNYSPFGMKLHVVCQAEAE